MWFCFSLPHDRSGSGRPRPHAILYHRRDVSSDAVQETGEAIHGAGYVIRHPADDQVEGLLHVSLQCFVEDSLPEASVDEAVARLLLLALQGAPGADVGDEHGEEQCQQQNQRAGPPVLVSEHGGRSYEPALVY